MTNTDPNPAPVAVHTAGTSFHGKIVVQVASGNGHSCARTTDGELWCWGRNLRGQLGTGDFEDSLVPVLVDIPGQVTHVAMTGRAQQTCALNSSGHAYCWGDNRNGAVGINSTTSSILSPTRVSSLPSPVTDIFTTATQSNEAATCAVANQRAYCWGYNGDGQVGDGTNTERQAPVAVSRTNALSGRNVERVVQGNRHSCALTDNNTVACWGSNGSGQVGVGTTGGSYTTPQTVDLSPLNGRIITDIDGGGNRNCVIAGGTNYCWGLNDNYQIGDGTTITRPLPTIATYLEQRDPPLVY